MNEIKVSVIVPVYNAEKFLSRTIEYLRNQTLEEIEIILVDDGSTDSSPLICDEACRSDGRIRCIHKANAGVSAARNDGIDAARGKYLMFCDADDIPKPVWIGKMYETIDAVNGDIVISGYYKETSDSRIEYVFPYTKLYDKNEIQHKIIMTMSMWGYAPEGEDTVRVNGGIWNRIYRKEIIDKYDIRFNKQVAIAEDVLFNIEYLNHSSNVYFVEDRLYTYCYNDASATHTNFEKLWSRYKTTWKYINEALKKCKVSDNDLGWHNFQFQKYAVMAIIEGVCSSEDNMFIKRKRMKEILDDKSLQKALQSVPGEINRKNKLIGKLMLHRQFLLLLLHYQKQYNKHYRR